MRGSGDGTSWPRAKPVAVIFAAVVLAGIVLSYVLRGTEGIAIFVLLAVGLGILFGWRTHERGGSVLGEAEGVAAPSAPDGDSRGDPAG